MFFTINPESLDVLIFLFGRCAEMCALAKITCELCAGGVDGILSRPDWKEQNA